MPQQIKNQILLRYTITRQIYHSVELEIVLYEVFSPQTKPLLHDDGPSAAEGSTAAHNLHDYSFTTWPSLLSLFYVICLLPFVSEFRAIFIHLMAASQ